jgi:hypothetical protein
MGSGRLRSEERKARKQRQLGRRQMGPIFAHDIWGSILAIRRSQALRYGSKRA